MAFPKPKLVIDTNVLITTINRNNPEFDIYKAFERKLFHWIVSTEVLTEYAEQITDFYSASTANFVLDVLCSATNVIFTEPYYRWQIIEEDPDDNKNNLVQDYPDKLCAVLIKWYRP